MITHSGKFTTGKIWLETEDYGQCEMTDAGQPCGQTYEFKFNSEWSFFTIELDRNTTFLSYESPLLELNKAGIRVEFKTVQEEWPPLVLGQYPSYETSYASLGG